MTDRRDDILDEIGQLLGIERSPEFAARVRTNIEDRASGARRVRAMWMSAAAAAIVLVGVASEFGRLRGPAVLPVRETRGDVTLMREAALETPTAATSHLRAVASQLAISVAVAPAEPTRAEDLLPDLTVVTNQPEVLRRTWAQFEASGSSVPVMAAIVVGGQVPAMVDFGPAVVVTEIVPTPIVLAEFDDGREGAGQVFGKSIQ